MKTVKNAPKVDNATVAEFDVEKNAEGVKQHDKAPEPKPKTTKKSVVISCLDQEGGCTIADMAQKIVDLGLDPDLDKNKRVVRLWISKIGFKTTKLEGGKYSRAI